MAVTSIEERYENLAKQFVDLYNTNPLQAARWARDAVGVDRYEQFQPYVTREFERRGYTFAEE